LCQIVHERLVEHAAVLLRSPPMSGKTSLAKTLSAWYTKCYPQERVIVVSLLSVDMDTLHEAHKAFRREWQQAAGFSWEERKQIRCTIIIDEAQRAYNFSEFSLWRHAKALQQGKYPQRLLCLSGYTPALLASGLTTPVSFPEEATLVLADMRLRATERTELFDRLVQLPKAARITPLPMCMLPIFLCCY
jgi:hypothetical protein